MKKYKITTAKNAANKGMVKVGDEFTVTFKVLHCDRNFIQGTNKHFGTFSFGNTKIRIHIPEQKPIDFGEAGRVLKLKTGYSGETIVMTTGFKNVMNNHFSCYILKSDSFPTGYAKQADCSEDWQDITDTYKP